MKNNKLNDMLDEHPYLLYRALEHEFYRNDLSKRLYGKTKLKRLDKDLHFYTKDRYGNLLYEYLLRAGAEGYDSTFYSSILKQMRDYQSEKKTRMGKSESRKLKHLNRELLREESNSIDPFRREHEIMKSNKKKKSDEQENNKKVNAQCLVFYEPSLG